MQQQTYLQIFRERWSAIVAGLVFGILVALVACFTIPATFTATATSFLSVRSTAATLTDGSQFALARIASYPALAVSSDVLGATIKQLDLHESVQQLSDSVSATNPPTTVLVQVSATATTGKEAALIANTVSTNLASTVSSLENTGSQNRYKVTLELRDRAQIPTSPSAPQRAVILGLGVLGGIAAGLIAALLWEAFDSTIRSPEDARRATGLPVIGELPQRRGSRFSSAAKRRSHLENTLRETQVTLRQSNGGRVPRFLLLVPASADAREGWVRGALARSFAESGRSVVLVEGDFDDDTATLLPNRDDAIGLAESFADPAGTVGRVLMPEDAQYSILPAGHRDNMPSEFVADENSSAVLRALGDSFALTISQVTSTTRPASLELFAPYTDGVIIVARWGRTRRSELGHALARLRLAGIRPLGIMIAGVPVTRANDLAANWRPEDFDSMPREPLRVMAENPQEPASVAADPAEAGSQRARPAPAELAPPQPARKATSDRVGAKPVARPPKRAPRARSTPATVPASVPVADRGARSGKVGLVVENPVPEEPIER